MEEIDKFISGFRRFQHKYFAEQTALYEGLQRKQSPKTLLIGCSDSRVDPALLMDCAPGDLFVIRNVANLVPPYEEGVTHQGVTSAIEYAISDLQVEQIIILGHSGCGGIRALMQGRQAKNRVDFVGRWMDIANPAKEYVQSTRPHDSLEAQIRACEMVSIRVSLTNLMSFPFISARVETGNLALHGWYFNITEGALYHFNAEDNRFDALVNGLPST